MTAYLVYPIEYLAPLYVALYGLWLIRENKAILFWLYLWQLKEYHWGRFFDHFSTAKGKRIFLNPVFITKAVVLTIFLSVYFFIKNSGNGSYFFSPASSFFFSRYYSYAFYFFAFSIFLIFAFEAVWTFISIFKRSIIHPVLTKKSILLIATVHLAAFALVFVLYGSILGEMGFFDFAIAAFCLLLFDLLTPLFVGLAVMIFQPLTVWEKNKVLKRAKTARETRSDLTVVGISGSYGKSITKELLAHVLAQKFKVLKTAANQNTEVGVSNALINGLEIDHKFFVCEIGAVHKGKIKLIANAVMPKVGILTGINQQHMAVFGNQRDITDGKYEILEALSEDGTAVANWGSELVRQSFESKKSGIRAKNVVLAAKDIFASDVRAETGRLSFKVNCKGESAFFEINARGAFNVEPILLAMAGAISCGMDFKEVAGIIEKTDFSPFNVKVNDRADGINVISSTYSANPDGVLAHLDYLKLWPGKKAIVMPCLIELGQSSKDVHYRIGQKIAEVCDLAVIATKDRLGEVRKGAVAAGMKKENIVFAERPSDAEKKIKEVIVRGDTILLEGRLPQGMAEKLKR
jgi:UDP-N-acetylmuramoyl-tripeptide--D-alanyl-D-alanine ligase